MTCARFSALALVVTVLTVGLLVSTSMSAPLRQIESKSIGEGTSSMALIDGKVSKVTHLVPKCGPPVPGADPCTNVTTIDVEFNLGCLDSLVVTNTASFNRRSNKIIVDVTALQLVNEHSKVAMCRRANVKRAMIEVKTDLPKVTADDVEVRFQKNFTNVQ